MSKLAMKPRPKSYYWTDQRIDWKGVDCIEVAGCIDLGDSIERAMGQADGEREDGHPSPDFYSVYIHKPHDWPGWEGGVQCIADRNTHREAIGLARTFGRLYSVPVSDYS